MIWSLLSAIGLLAVVAAIFHANAQDDPSYQIHKRQQRLLKDHHKAMRLWCKRDIKPHAWWKRWAD